MNKNRLKKGLVFGIVFVVLINGGMIADMTADGALIPYFGKITATVTVGPVNGEGYLAPVRITESVSVGGGVTVDVIQSVWVDGLQYPASEISEEFSGVAGDTVCTTHWLENKASVPIDIKFETFDDCDGITTTIYDLTLETEVTEITLGSGETRSFRICYSFDKRICPGTYTIVTKILPGGRNIIYVPDDYPIIQSAIDNASDGDTIFVFNDIYYENVVMDKSINLIGEDMDTTVIDGGGVGDVVHISADGVNFTGFSIQKSSGINDTGISIASSYNSISGNNIVNNPNCGIYIGFSYHDNNIVGNIITNTDHGIIIHDSHENTITENTISNINYYSGINLDNATNNIISGNIITNTYGSGIDLYSSSDNNVFENIVINGNGGGICLGYSSNNNLLYHNNLINNTQNAYNTGTNTWDNGYHSGGNYWDDYTGVDNDGDGIGDIPYPIPGGDNEDRYPLMEPYGMTIRINEIMYNPQGSDVGREWIELYNTADYAINITGWCLYEQGVNYTLTLKKGSMEIPEGGFAVIADNHIKFLIDYPSYSGTLIDSTFSLKNSGEYLAIKNDALEIIDEVTYVPQDGANNTGMTLEYKVDDIWEVSYEYGGTPGAINSETCTIKLQKDGVPIDNIDVGEFFDICVTDYSGNIQQIRFLSDEYQNGTVDSGFTWTDWYDWDTSTSDWTGIWDHVKKIKTWAFATAGIKEVWAEVNGADQTGRCSANIYANQPSFNAGDYVKLIEDIEWFDFKLRFEPSTSGDVIISLDWLAEWSYGGGQIIENENNGIFADGYYWWYIKFIDWWGDDNIGWVVEDAIELNQRPIADFSISNNNPKTLEEILLDATASYDPDGEIIYYYWECWNKDKNKEIFKGQTISPFIYYYWDKNEGGSCSVRLKVIDNNGIESEAIERTIQVNKPWLQWEKGAKKISKDTINKIKDGLDIPQYLDEIPYLSSEYNFFSSDWLIGAILHKPILNKEILSNGGDWEYMNKFLFEARIADVIQDMELVDYIAGRSFNPDGNVPAFFDNMADINEWVTGANTVIDMLLTSILSLKGSYIGSFGISAIFMIPTLWKIGIELKMLDNLLYRKGLWCYFHERDMGSGWAWDAAKYFLPPKYHYDETKNYFEKLWEEYGPPHISPSGGLKEGFKNDIKTELRDILFLGYESYKFEPLYKQVKLKSPAELRVYDSEGSITGYIDGEIIEEIPKSNYDEENESVVLFIPFDSYWYNVVGTENGTYGLDIIYFKNGEYINFTASDIVTSANQTHQYTINWSALSQGEEGVTLQIDYDGDDTFEKTITSDEELTHDEFMLQTTTIIDIDPDTLNLNSNGKWITCYIELPYGYDVADIDIDTILLNDVVPSEYHPTNISDYDNDGIPDLMIKFDRQAVQDILEPGENVAITVTGKLFDGTMFEGTDYIRVI